MKIEIDKEIKIVTLEHTWVLRVGEKGLEISGDGNNWDLVEWIYGDTYLSKIINPQLTVVGGDNVHT